jgi:hypothetical protein
MLLGVAQAFMGVAIGLGGAAVASGVGIATAYVTAELDPTAGLGALVPAFFAFVITDGLLLVTMVVVGIRHIRGGRRPLGIGLLVIPLLQPVLLVGWFAHLSAR